MLWHAYPVIGLDERNQFDFYRDVPELPDAGRRRCSARGVRVFVDYNPWDVGTRREPVDDADGIAALVRDLGADGVFLDTLKEGAGRAARRAARPGRGAGRRSRGCRWRGSATTRCPGRSGSPTRRCPGVLRARWFERRHMLHHTRRWHRDHIDELHSAWLNGAGVLVWDAVFGVWVGWNARDRAMLRAMRPVQRARRPTCSSTASGRRSADHPGDGAPVYASRWDAPTRHCGRW